MKISNHTTDFSETRVIGLDLLRACSIMFVLFSHGGGFLLRKYHDLLIPIVYLGVIGVEIFFILSGYLIGTIIIKTFKESYTHEKAFTFLIRRWFRTIPNYLLFLTINLIVLFALKSPFEFEKFLITISTYLTFTQNFFTYRNETFFPESWSLAIEEWFYVIIIVTTVKHIRLIFSVFENVLGWLQRMALLLQC